MLMRERPAVPGALPALAPLPSLTAALSRRSAIFGAFAVSGALTISAAVRAANANSAVAGDTALIAWADELPEIDAALSDLFARAPDVEADARIDALSTRWCAATDGIQCTPARGQAGIAAKARAVAHLAAQGDMEVATPIAASLAADVLRLGARA